MTIKLVLSAMALLMLGACSNDPRTTDVREKEKKADSLFQEVKYGHDIGMAKDKALKKAKEVTQRAIDSINKLPAYAKRAAEPYKQQLDSLFMDLSKADNGMTRWMEEMKWDASKIELEERINYLANEKLKVDKVKEDILQSLAKADSLIREKL